MSTRCGYANHIAIAKRVELLYDVVAETLRRPCPWPVVGTARPAAPRLGGPFGRPLFMLYFPHGKTVGNPEIAGLRISALFGKTGGNHGWPEAYGLPRRRPDGGLYPCGQSGGVHAFASLRRRGT